MTTPTPGAVEAPAHDTKRRRGLGPWLRRAFVALLILVPLLLIGASGYGVYFVQRTLPQTRGTLAVAGLGDSVSVVRDEYGVPHITGTTLHDVFFAQGYVTAQDRLFQLEFNRRVAQGRLAEMFGPGSENSLVKTDTFLRTLSLYPSAAIELATLDVRSRAELQAYADGINAFVGDHKDSLPLEFAILGITPEKWMPLDSLAYGRVVALSLDDQWNIKYARAQVLAKAGPTVAASLFPAYPDENPTVFDDATAGGTSGTSGASSSNARASLGGAAASHAPLSSAPLEASALVQSLLGPISESLGSNDWVVDGTRTTTGKPLLANDPHLGINMPSIWYEVGLRGGGLDVIGFSFPGVPGVVIGHNGHIAWGVTNVGADDSDLYLETLDPAGHPGQYKRHGEWIPLTSRSETIKVRGGQPVTITVSATDHGPLLNSAVGDLKDTAPVALKWTVLQPGYSFRGFFELNFATNWREFLDAVADISISQNFVYADTDGNIGYRMSGVLPIRPRANGLLPVDGDNPANEWKGYVPQSEMPSLFNPPAHQIATANNRIVPDSDPVYVTSQWDAGYRARRITDLLNASAKVSPDDFARIQTDVTSVVAARLAPEYVKAGLAAGGDAAEAAKLLQGWDFAMTRESVAAGVYEVTSGTLAREVIEPLLGKDEYAVWRENVASSSVFQVLVNAVAPSGNGAKTSLLPDASARQAAMAKALADAYHDLSTTRGTDHANWAWGKLHQAHFDHPLATVQPLDRIFGLAPVARPGDSTTVNVGGAGGFSADSPSYNQASVPSMRQILDLADLDNSRWVTTTGESGQPFNAHYSDLIPLWDQGHYQPMPFTPEALAKHARDVLTLKPR